MKAAQINEYGHADVLKITEADKPVPGEGQVLVEVRASSINPFDGKVREGYMQQMRPLEFPATLGGDIAGVVAESSSGAEGLKAGDKVYGQASLFGGGSGAFAEFAAAIPGQIALMPKNLEFIEAAALPLAGVSALQAITGHIKLAKGQKILIHGGGGGIGSIAVQIAKKLGAYAATTASGDGIEYTRNLGADEVIDYKSQKFEDILKDYDAVFDTVGGDTYTRSYAVLKPDGIIVSMTESPNEDLMREYGVTAIAQGTKVTTESLNELTQLVESGAVTAHVGQVFPLEKIQAAFEAKESGRVNGKIVISIKDQSANSKE